MPNREKTSTIIWRLIYPILIFIGVEIVIEMVFLFGYMFYLIGTNRISPSDLGGMTDTLNNFAYRISLYITLARSAALIPIFIVLMRRDKVRDVYYQRYVKFEPLNRKWLLILPVLGFAAAMGFNHLVPMLLEALQSIIHVAGKTLFGVDWNVDFFRTYDSLSEIIYSGSIFVQILATAVAAPVVEELLFRGLIYKRLRDYLKFTPSALISAFVFGVIHGNAVQFLYAFFIGIILAFVYEKFKTVAAPVIFHGGANLISVIVTFFIPDEGIGLSIGEYMLLVVVELAVVFLLLWLIDNKINRKKIESS